MTDSPGTRSTRTVLISVQQSGKRPLFGTKLRPALSGSKAQGFVPASSMAALVSQCVMEALASVFGGSFILHPPGL